jgi:putative addiction module component (TIGR02574 family)
MSIAEVRRLPLREKLQILEVIWEDLSAKVDEMEISDAERKLLDSRLERVRKGEARILDWEEVKHTIGSK